MRHSLTRKKLRTSNVVFLVVIVYVFVVVVVFLFVIVNVVVRYLSLPR